MIHNRFVPILFLVCAETMAAASITVVNNDFETGGFVTDNFSRNPGVIPNGWTAAGGTTGAYYGYFNPSNFEYPGAWGGTSVVANMAGPNVFYFGSFVHGEGIQQTVSASYEDQTNYTLTVAVGGRFESLAYTASLDMRLLAGSTVLASRTVRNAEGLGSFVDFSLTYAHTPSFSCLVGQPLTIQFLENNTEFSGELEIDNVRLESVSVIPEPAVATLWAGAVLLGYTGTCRRRVRGSLENGR